MKYQFFRYLFVGVFNTLIGYGVIFLCMYVLSFSPELSNLIGYLLGMIFSFTVNRRFTFKSTQNPGIEFLKFIVVCFIAWLANIIVLILLVRVLHFHPGYSQIVSGSVYVVAGYLMNKVFVFKSGDSVRI